MNFKFNKKIVSCLFILIVAGLCIGAVNATDVHNNDVSDGFTVSGSDICANVHGDSSTGSHWKVAGCKGYKLVSCEFCPPDSKEMGSIYSEKFHFQKLPSNLFNFFSKKYIKLNEIDSSGKIIKTIKYPRPKNRNIVFPY